MFSNSAVALLVLVGCNQVFGNHGVEQAPNQIFDAPIDAPFQCTAIGTTPTFSYVLHQYKQVDCYSYAESSGEAIASCGGMVELAPIGDPLVRAQGVMSDQPNADPRLAPDGSYMLLGGNLANRVDLYRHDSDWTLAGSTNLHAAVLGNVVHAGGVDRMLEKQTGTSDLQELVFDGDLTWTPVATHDLAELGVVPQSTAWLTPDGLRVILDANDAVYYSDRASVDRPFRTADKLTVPLPPKPAMSDDCARIYLTGLGAVFYVQQR